MSGKEHEYGVDKRPFIYYTDNPKESPTTFILDCKCYKHEG